MRRRGSKEPLEKARCGIHSRHSSHLLVDGEIPAELLNQLLLNPVRHGDLTGYLRYLCGTLRSYANADKVSAL